MPIERHFDYYNSAKYLSEFLFSYQKLATTLTIFPYLVVIRRVVIISAKNILEPLFLQRHFGTMLRFTNKIKLILTILSILSLSSCGGGGGDGDSSPQSRKTGTITGTVFDAPISGGVVTAYEYKNGVLGRELGQTKTNASGEYTLNVDSASMPVYIKVQGGGYRDPFSNNVVRTSSNGVIELASVINFSEGETAQVMITPMTYMAQGLAEYKIKREGQSASSAINSALSTINSMYGFNVNTVNPIDITTGGHDAVATDGHKYGALLTAYSSYAYSFLENDSTGAETYTSINLARIGYDDIVADGLLDGKVLDDSRDFLEDARFGTQYITSDFYTHSVAEHTLIVVSDPNVNVSGTPVNQYETTVNHLNNLGTSGGEGSIPSRQPKEMDKNAPTAKRSDTSVLVGTESMEVTLEDETGVEGLSVTVKYLAKNTSDPSTGTEVEVLCEQDTASICWLDKTSFVKGPRKTTLKVFVNTTSLDESVFTGTVDANLIVRTVDVLNNEDNSGIALPFKWDNVKPVIEFTSSESVRNTDDNNNKIETYILKGIVKETLNDIVDQSVYLTIASSGDPIKIECKELNTQCQFSYSYETELFSASVEFTVAATDIYGNKGEASYTVYKDDQPPQVSLTFSEALFNYKQTDGSGYSGLFDQTTFPSGSVDSLDRYLDIDFALATSGLNETHEGLNYKDFELSEGVLQSNSIPYFIATIKDLSDRNTYGSSADDLTLRVEYLRKRSTEDKYSLVSTKTQVASEAFDDNSGIPFKRLPDESSEERVFSMDYYLPLTADLLSDFANASEGDSQLIQVSVEDPAGNSSDPQQVYFKTTFERPTLTIVTPFVGAIATVEGWNEESKKFEQIQSCTDFTHSTTNVATCSMPYNTRIQFYNLFRVTLQNGQDTYYHQWSNSSKDDAVKYTADFADAAGAIGTYFTKAETKTIYLTEFSAYHTGLFEYLWNKSAKTVNDAETILTDVAKAIVGDSDSKPLLGFDPFSSRYATNENMISVPDNPATAYQYRILLESLAGLSSETTSLEYAFAFYKDLKADGLANGNAESDSGSDAQKPIQVGDKYISISADTYRENLAKGYYDLAVSYGVDSQNAVAQADVFATANPTIDDTPIFKDAGGSIDNEPPVAIVSMDTTQDDGAYVAVSENVYTIAGKVYSLITVTDISGVDLAASEFRVYWYHSDNPTERKETNIVFEEASGDTYEKKLKFAIDSTNALYQGVTRFEAYATVLKDVKNNTSNGEALLATFNVDNVAPKGLVEKTEPEYPVDGSAVDVTVKFDKPVNQVEATIDDIKIDFGESSQTKTEWVGTSLGVMSLEVNETSKSIKVKNTYSDALGNVGAELTASVGVKPVITINDVATNNIIQHGDEDISAVVISGTTKGIESGAKLSLTVTSEKGGRKDIDKYEPDDFKDLKVQIDGTWSQTVSFQTWEEAKVSISVSGTNDQGGNTIQPKAEEVTYKDKVLPSLSESGSMIQMSGGAETSLADSVLVDGKAAKVTLKFSERVTEPTASLNSQSITFDQPQGGVSDQWVGQTAALDLPVNASTAKLEVSYQDTASEPNPGSFSKDIDLKPVIAINHIDSFNSDSDLAKSFVISGTSKGIQNGAKLTIKVYLKDELKYQHEDVQVTNGVWTLDPKNISTWESGEIRITVNGENDKKLAAEEASLAIAFTDDIQPSVQSVVLSPEKPADGEEVTVTVTFSEPVSGTTGTLDGQALSFTGPSETKSVWVGTSTVDVGVGELSMTLQLSGFQDASLNAGTDDPRTVTVTPTVTITALDKIDSTEVSDVVVSGTGVGLVKDDEVTVTVTSKVDSDKHWTETVSIGVDGSWKTSGVDMSAWPLGYVTVVASGKNANNVVSQDAVDENVEIIDTAEPSVQSVVLSPEKPADGEEVTVTVTFSEPVSGTTGTLDGQALSFTGPSETKSVWVGTSTVDVGVGELSMTLQLSGFQDASLNAGTDDPRTVTVTPTVTITALDKIDSTEVSDVVVSGTGVGLVKDDEVTVTVTSKVDSDKHWTETVSIGVDGSWKTSGVDMSAWPLGYVTVVASGKNANNVVSQDAVDENVEIIDTAEPSVQSVVLSPEKPADGEEVTVTVTFSEPVSGTTGTLDGQALSFTGPSETKSVWVGTSTVDVGVGELSMTLQLSGFQDASLNAGTDDPRTVTVTPTVTITALDKIDSTEVSDVVVSGTGVGLVKDDEVTVTVTSKVDSDKHWTETVSIGVDGSWKTSGVDMSAWPLGYVTVVASGKNANNVVSQDAVDENVEIIDTAEPSVQSVVLSPEKPADGEEVTVTVTFSEPVSGTTGTLDGQALSFTGPSETKSVWVGTSTVDVGVGELSMTLQLSGFQDASLNAGTDDPRTVTVTPTVTITALDKIDSTEVSDVVVSGTGVGLVKDDEVTVTVTSKVDSDKHWTETVSIGVDGSWKTSGVDMSAWPLGYVTVVASGKNANNVVSQDAVDENVEIIDTAEPSVQSVVLSPEKPADGEEVTVTVTFSEPVSGTTGTLDGQALSFTGPSETKSVWVGTSTVDVGVGELSMTLQLSGFQDASLNAGTDDPRTVTVTPTVTITALDKIDSTEVSDVVVSGTGVGLVKDDEVTVTVTSKVDSDKHWTETVSIGVDGSWKTSGVDMSAWPLGYVTVVASGKNANNVVSQNAVDENVEIISP
ncbi:tandem large repeat [Vibrio sp. THAF191d]|uniref:tandem large repeat n=1 Tax=Vibrio sp. THAF191d TaxID=2661922 RepID=UPI0012AF02B0|nr:tandem large repeat [Vibrio sp. THAF191d]QGM36706.1 hydrogenase 1 maturation protease [Vibrio sp. THAF191d]